MTANIRSHREGGLEVTKSSIEGELNPIPNVKAGTDLKSQNQCVAQVSPVWSSLTVIIVGLSDLKMMYQD